MINEAFTQPYSIIKSQLYNPPHVYEYQFITEKGLTYVVTFSTPGFTKGYAFEFALLYDEKGNSIDDPQGVIGSGDAFRVMSTVLKCFDLFLKQQPDVPFIKFTAESPSRRKLYERLIKTLSHKYPKFTYKIDKNANWRWVFYIKPRSMKNFNQFYSENEENEPITKLMRWIEDNSLYYKQVGRSSILAGGKVKVIDRQPNTYTKMIKPAAFKGQAGDSGFIENFGEYTVYAIEAEVVPMGGDTPDFKQKTVMMQIDKDGQPYKTYLMNATNIQSIKKLLSI